MTATADLPNKNIKDFTEKLSFVDADKSIIIDSEDGDKLKLIAKSLMKGDDGVSVESVSFVGDDMVFVLDDASTVTLTGAKTTLAGTDGTDGLGITSIVKTGTVGLVDTYTITYSDSTTSTFDITNGDDGTDGDDGNGIASITTNKVGKTTTVTITETDSTVTDFDIEDGTDGTGAGDMVASTYDPTSVEGDAFDMDNMIQGTTNKFISATQLAVLGNTSGTNTGDQTLPVKATGAEVDTGTDDAKFVTAKAVADSKLSYTDGTETLTNKTITDAKTIQSINAQTGTTYTFVLTDASKLVTFGNASAIAVTIPTNASVAFPVGTQIDCSQILAGKVTFGGSGVTINSKGGLKSINGQRVGVSLLKTDTDTWLLVGDLIA